MSNNPPNPNEYLRLLLQLQQAQAQQHQSQIGAAPQAAPPPAVQHTHNSPTPASQGALASLRNILAGLSSNGGAPAGEPSAPAFALQNAHPVAVPNQAAVAVNASAGNNDVLHQQQLLMASAQLLMNVNPQLAAAAVEQAVSMASRTNTAPAQFDQLNAAHLHQHHHHALKKSSPTSSSNSSGNSNPSQASSSIRSLRDNSDVSTTKKEVEVFLPSEPVNILTLQTWSLEKLEAYSKQLTDNNKKIPDAVKILLDDARQRKEKLHAKRISNRKFASASRARKNQLISELTKSNRQLRRGALVLSYLPDPVVAIDLNGTIKFCSTQMERVLQHRLDDLIGANIEHICVPKSRGTIRRSIRDLVTAEELAAGGEGPDRGNDSGDSSNDTNVLSRRSDQSFPLLEVNVDDQHAFGSGENVSDSSSGGALSKEGEQKKRHKDGSDKSNSRSTMSSLTQKSSFFSSEMNHGEPEAKKSKPNESGSASTSNSKTSGAIGMNVDDVMGSSVTANNAGAKLSSLMHYPREDQDIGTDNRKPPPEGLQQGHHHIHKKHSKRPSAAAALARKLRSRSSSSTDSQRGQTGGQNSSEDSGYRESNESSDSALDSSSMSGVSLGAKGRKYRPLAPCCNVRLVRADLTTLWCELTLSIRTRDLNDEDSELGIIDLNPKPTTDSESNEPREEKELLLCFRPFLIGGKVGDELKFPPHQISESSNANEGSGDITSSNKSSSNKSSSNKSSSGNDDKKAANSGSDAPSSETQLNVASENSNEHHQKKRSLENPDTATIHMSSKSGPKKHCMAKNRKG